MSLSELDMDQACFGSKIPADFHADQDSATIESEVKTASIGTMRRTSFIGIYVSHGRYVHHF